MTRVSRLLLVVAFLTVSCGGTVDFTGEYNTNVTNGENACNFENWTVGQSTANIPVSVTQTEEHVQAEVKGLVGLGMNLILGSATFAGTGSGISLDLALIGDVQGTRGPNDECVFTTNATLDATLNGDLLQGTITLTPVTNGHTECAELNDCTSVQSFNGLRPPTS